MHMHYIYKHTYINIHTCIHTHIYTYTYKHTHTHTHTHTYIYIGELRARWDPSSMSPAHAPFSLPGLAAFPTPLSHLFCTSGMLTNADVC